jgi:hypothetical protein
VGLTAQGSRALRDYLDDAFRHGPGKRKIYAAVELTPTQAAAVERALQRYWNYAGYRCPARLSLKPLHGFESRVSRDGFSAGQYGAWLELGCSDRAVVACDFAGRPFLFTTGMVATGTLYDLVVPIRSDVRGNVWIDDVIPKGLWPSRS